MVKERCNFGIQGLNDPAFLAASPVRSFARLNENPIKPQHFRWHARCTA
jgi:hypothetical protein